MLLLLAHLAVGRLAYAMAQLPSSVCRRRRQQQNTKKNNLFSILTLYITILCVGYLFGSYRLMTHLILVVLLENEKSGGFRK